MEQLATAIKFFQDNWISISSLILSIFAVGITWKTHVIDRHYANDKDLLEQLKSSMDIAYNSISRDDGNEHYPISDRLKWLICARHIIRYNMLKSNLKTKLFKTICDEQEEFWRNNFYSLLEKIDSVRFYSDEMIEPRSAAIILAFSTWKEDMDDPIEDFKLEDIVIKHNLFTPKYRYFKEYIEEKFPERAKKIQSLITSQST